MTRKLILAVLILLQAGCSSLTPPASSPTPSLTPLPPAFAHPDVYPRSHSDGDSSP